MLNNMWFAGDVIPRISLETIIIEGTEIDVLTIFNEEKTPIYLKRSYGNMMQGCIYTRTKDKNTPDKGNAYFYEIESLWKKRFGLYKTPLEYIFDRLSDFLAWKQENNIYYYMYKPEYQLSIKDDDSSKPEFYSYVMTNSSSYNQILQIRYNETVLEEYQITILDSGRYITSLPKWGNITITPYSNSKYIYKYFILGSRRYKIYKFFLDRTNNEGLSANQNFTDVVLIYNSDLEKSEFETYVIEKRDILKKRIEKQKECSELVIDKGQDSSEIKNLLYVGFELNKLLEEFRIKK